MAQSDDLYARTDWLVRELRAAGMPVAAGRLAHLLHGVAWATSSELIGELGQAFWVIQREHEAALPPEIARELGSAIAAARRVWPDPSALATMDPDLLTTAGPPEPSCGRCGNRRAIPTSAHRLNYIAILARGKKCKIDHRRLGHFSRAELGPS